MKLLIVFTLALATASAVTNGKEGKASYQVGIVPSNGGFCGGVLLDHDVILTAASCVGESETLTIYLGSSKRESAEVKCIAKRRNIHKHPKWDNTRNNIAIVEVDFIKFTDNIQAIKLPALNETHPDYVAETVAVYGWGFTSDAASNLADTLQAAELQIIGNDECSKHFTGGVTDNDMCADTSGGVSTCTGDAGGPVVLKSNNILVGLVAFQSGGGCEEGHPVGFIRISKYLQWIADETGISY